MRHLPRLLALVGVLAAAELGAMVTAVAAEDQNTTKWRWDLPQSPCALICNEAPDCDCAII